LTEKGIIQIGLTVEERKELAEICHKLLKHLNNVAKKRSQSNMLLHSVIVSDLLLDTIAVLGKSWIDARNAAVLYAAGRARDAD